MSIRSERISPRRVVGQVLVYTLLGLVALAVGLPVLWFLVSSLKTESEYIAYPIRFLPKVPIWRNYVDAVTLIPYLKYAGRSAFLATVFAALTVVTSSMAGYAFAKMQFPGKDILFVFVIATLMIPFSAILIPLSLPPSRRGGGFPRVSTDSLPP